MNFFCPEEQNFCMEDGHKAGAVFVSQSGEKLLFLSVISQSRKELFTLLS